MVIIQILDRKYVLLLEVTNTLFNVSICALSKEDILPVVYRLRLKGRLWKWLVWRPVRMATAVSAR